MPQSSLPEISFEFFPARGEKGKKSLTEIFQNLATLTPKYATVTYGADGSAQDGSLQTLRAFKAANSNIPLASHLTYIAADKGALAEYTDTLWDEDVHHIVALRGDARKGMTWEQARDQSAFTSTADFITWLKSRHDFEISVGAYPEKHPDAPTAQADLDTLKQKCDAGANRAITQFFFDNDIYYRFLDAAEKKGIETPIVPGILPIMNFDKMVNFANKCASSVPLSLRESFAKHASGSDAAMQHAHDVLSDQIEDLTTRGGVEEIHFYSMNSARLLLPVCNKLGLKR